MTSTSQFQYQLTRWDKKRSRRLLGYVQHMHAENFGHAVERLDDVLDGMRAADPDSEFDVVFISHVGFSGEQCTGPGMFEWRAAD